MAGHRRLEPQAARVPSVWFIVWSVFVVVVSAAGLGYLAWDQSQSDTPPPLASASPTPSLSPSVSPTPSVSPSPEVVNRDINVWVYNNSRVSGLAERTATQARQAGWTVDGWSNWTGQIPRTTVYYPEGKEDQARLLAEDLGIKNVEPIIDTMKSDLLTVIVTSVN